MQEHNSTPNPLSNSQDKDTKITPKAILNDAKKLAGEHGNEITGEQLLKYDVQSIPCLIEPFFQMTGLACLAGSSDTGKSSLLRQLSIYIAAGESQFLGFTINATHRSVIYVSTEDLETETAYLIKRQAKDYQPGQLKGLRFLFEFDNLKNELETRLSILPADLVIIDCFADVFVGDLKDTQKIRAFLNPFQELALKHKCLILFLHHTGKRTEHTEPSKNNLLSGQGFEAKMRLVIELRSDSLNPNKRHLCIVKGNYLPASFKKESYVLEFDEKNFLFTNSGERTPFELLAKSQDEDGSKEKFQRAHELKESGYTYEQIASELGYASKGSISKLFAKAKRLGWDREVSNGNDGNGKETK